jgi:hypothetical protein
MDKVQVSPGGYKRTTRCAQQHSPWGLHNPSANFRWCQIATTAQNIYETERAMVDCR